MEAEIKEEPIIEEYKAPISVLDLEIKFAAIVSKLKFKINLLSEKTELLNKNKDALEAKKSEFMFKANEQKDVLKNLELRQAYVDQECRKLDIYHYMNKLNSDMAQISSDIKSLDYEFRATKQLIELRIVEMGVRK